MPKPKHRPPPLARRTKRAPMRHPKKSKPEKHDKPIEQPAVAQVVELGLDLSARLLGEPIEGHAHHRLGGHAGNTEQTDDRLDRGRRVLGLHHEVEYFMPTFESLPIIC